MRPPLNGLSWLELTEECLDVGLIYSWCLQPSCGAVVLFSGVVRDHSVDGEGRRDGVTELVYEAYDSQLIAVFARLEAQARTRWPSIERVAILHRSGAVGLSESSVVIAVASPHRSEAFDAGRWLIDALKASAPIWKQEHWDGGAAWGTDAVAPVGAGQATAS